MRAALILALAAAPAFAESRYQWGSITIDGRCTLELTRCPTGDCWEVSYYNVLTAHGEALFELELNGMTVTAHVEPGDNTIPDTFYLSPPPGWMAEPARIEVEEGTFGFIRLVPIPLG